MTCIRISGCSATRSASFSRLSVVRGFGPRNLVKIGFMVACLCLAVFSLCFSPSSASAAGGGHIIKVNPYMYNGSIVQSDFSQSRATFLLKTDSTGYVSTGSPYYRIDNDVAFVKGETVKLSFTVYYMQEIYNKGPSSLGDLVRPAFNCPSAESWTRFSVSSCQIDAINLSSTVATTYPTGDLNFGIQTFSIVYAYRVNLHLTPLSNFTDSLISTSGELFSFYGQPSTNYVVSLLFDALTSTPAIIAAGDQAIIGATNSNTAAVNNAANQAHTDSQAQTNAINQQTKQEQDQYEKEKQEEADRENQGKDDSNGLLDSVNFQLFNPFASLFSLFVPSDGCVQIPTLAGWLHSESSTVCSWWSPSVRNVLTPVFGISSMMLLFGFIVRWLNGSSEPIDGIHEGFKGF